MSVLRWLIPIGLVSAAFIGAPFTAELRPADPALVTTEGGALRGVTSGSVTSWKGIPYAAPPLGALRWRVPQPVTPWTGVKAASAFGPECMQADDVQKSEDCLTLNVWRPTASVRPLPVMVWIYGGALVHGSTSLYPADGLAKQGVVVVSVNYRMGRLGFFAHPALAAESPGDVRGNYGYMDQRAALQWVQRNIAAFDGDPTSVTIVGESAGGGSVLVHLTSPLSRGLFHRAIIQSPGIPAPRAMVTPLTALGDAERMAVDYARSIGVSGDGPVALASLRAVPPGKFIEGTESQTVVAALSAGTPVIGLAGSIRDGKLVVETPQTAVRSGRQAGVPVIIGANDRDLGIGHADTREELFSLFGSDAAAARMVYDRNGVQTLDEIKQQVFADKTMTEPARHLADALSGAGQPVWLYRFSYVPESQRGTAKGTLHAFEIPYTFNLPAALVKDKVTAADKAMADLASAYWVAFGLTGDPNGSARPAWPRYDAAVDQILNFTNRGVVVGPDPLKPRLDLWQRVWSRDAGSNH